MVIHININHGHGWLTSVIRLFTLTAFTLGHACVVQMLAISRMGEQ